jgi:hypothetical protein
MVLVGEVAWILPYTRLKVNIRNKMKTTKMEITIRKRENRNPISIGSNSHVPF